jgi:hypothetical protein
VTLVYADRVDEPDGSNSRRDRLETVTYLTGARRRQPHAGEDLGIARAVARRSALHGSAIAAIRVPASPDFHICVTMNDDSGVLELPGYIQSRLKPKIELVPHPWKIKEEIVRLKCPELMLTY